jgi:hypothetical protein
MKFSMTDTVYKIWKSQKGQCPCCKHRIDESTKWHIHHALPRNNGGSDKINNLLLMHPECHRQIHSRSIAGLPIHGNFIYAWAVAGKLACTVLRGKGTISAWPTRQWVNLSASFPCLILYPKSLNPYFTCTILVFSFHRSISSLLKNPVAYSNATCTFALVVQITHSIIDKPR